MTTRAIRTAGGVIDLAPLRDKLGDAWQQFGPSVHRIVSRIIRQEIRDDVAFARQFDTYILVFTDVSETHARDECAKIAGRIEDILKWGMVSDEPALRAVPLHGSDNAAWPRIRFRLVEAMRNVGRFLGLKSDSPAPPKGGHAETDKRLDFLCNGGSSPRSLTRHGMKAEVDIDNFYSVREPPNDNSAFQHDVSQRTSTTLLASRSDKNGATITASAGQMRPSGGTARLVASRMGGRDTLFDHRVLRLPHGDDAGPAHASSAACVPGTMAGTPVSAQANGALERAIERAADEKTRRQEREASAIVIFPPADLRLEYRPFWNLKSNLLTTYGIVPACNRRGQPCAGYTNILPRHFTGDETLALDKLLLQESVATLASTARSENLALVITSLHAATLQHAATALEFIHCCKSIRKSLSSRLLFEIVNVDRLIGLAEAHERVVLLSTLGRGVLGRTSIKAKNLSVLKAIRVTAVGFDLSDDRQEEALLMKDLDIFAVVAQRSKLESYARGLSTLSLTVAAVGAGIGYLEGVPLNRSDSSNKLRILPFRINKLYGLPSDQRGIEPAN